VATAQGTQILLSALVGAVGLAPTLAAIDRGIDVALANKEVMVVAGELVRRRALASGARVLPVDSEHNAIFQALQGRERAHVRRILLTASGGPFREHTLEQLSAVTREQALRHPTWNMGDKITIDSATLMNKGLEVIEARWFFDTLPEQIEVVVHPQSIVHSMVEYRDGSVVALLAVPDMTIPVGYALAYPDLLDLGHVGRLDLAACGQLTFHRPDVQRFPCLDLAYAALRAGGTMPAVANAANEVAVARFLAGDVGFTEIFAIIRQAMTSHQPRPYDRIDELEAVDDWARRHASDYRAARAAVRA
jgi:1-deoxy-D-xylulose-5-phosphate reductoisomerase